MEAILKNSNYVNPLTGEVMEGVRCVDFEFTDNPLLKEIKISFCLYKEVTELSIIDAKPTKKTKILSVDTKKFTKDSEQTTYVTLTKKGGQTETRDLLKYIEAGNKLTGKELIEIGYPSYESVQKYLFKDNIGDSLLINPENSPLQKQLVKRFIEEHFKFNGEPLGNQFYIEI